MNRIVKAIGKIVGRRKGAAYFIDSENVQNRWLNITSAKYTSDDVVFFVRSKSSIDLPPDVRDKCQAEIRTIWIDGKGKNAMDIAIGAMIGSVMKRYDRIYIVSNDTGYAPFINLFNTTYDTKIERIGTPSDEFTRLQKAKELIKKLSFDDDIKDTLCDILCKYYKDSEISLKVFGKLCEIYGMENAEKYYPHMKKAMQALKKKK